MFYIHQNQLARLLSSSLILLFLVEGVAGTAYAQSATSTEPVSSIETGEAAALTELESIVNSNITDTIGDTEVSSASSTPSAGQAVASSTNEANVENTSTTTADSGVNSIDGETATIITGNGYAVANVVNLVNTNILNSNGLIQFFTALGLTNIDVRNLFSVFDTTTALSTAPCAQSICGDSGQINQTTTDNTAQISNSIIVRANTGGNSIDGSGTIATGNAYAAANIFNVANTNITDSNYLLVSINNLGSLNGDIVLPTAALLNQLFRNGSVTNTGSIQNDSTAVIENNLTTVADTGNNESTGGAITTGDAKSSAGVTNKVNQNLVGGNSFLILLRVHGNWSGDIFGLPNNLLWSESPNGVTIYDPGNETASSSNAGGHAVQNTNNATIRNNVSVFALTGDNKIDGSGGTIATGNAYAAASITNLANLNIFSQNWALLIFDIFGNWGGNITFGRPDLWVGVKASSPDKRIMPGSPVNYTFTVSNLGDTPATNVTLNNLFDTGALQFANAAEQKGSNGKTTALWQLGTIPAGETREVTYTARVGDMLPRNTITTIPLTVAVSAKETEDNKDNNSDTIAIESGIVRSGGRSNSVENANLTLSKRALVSQVAAPGTADYIIDIENTGGPLFNAILTDTLRNETGDIAYEGYWNLDRIAAGEKISVSYSVAFASTTSYGTYTNTAKVTGTLRTSKQTATNSYVSPAATATIEITSSPIGLVLGASTCDEYLSTYLRINQANDQSEVEKLQQFLNRHLGLALDITGIFDESTLTAVKAFQQRYHAEILSPWGLTAPTGYVYLTTRKAINEIQCNYTASFPLTPVEQLTLAYNRF